MSLTIRSGLALVCMVVAAAELCAQGEFAGDRPKLHAPSKPETPGELNRREAVVLYGVAILQEREHRLVEAVRTLEQVARLDPESAAAYRTLCPLYLALDRADDALIACRKVLDLEPTDFQTWYLYGRQLRLHDR